MRELRIRHAEPSDYDQVIAVIDDWWGGRPMACMLPRLFFVHFRSTSFVAEKDRAIAGFVTGFVSQTFPEEAYIHFIGVHPAFQKNGLARKLYETFFIAVRELGCRVVRCVTSPINKDSISFHRHMGFRTAEEGTMIGTPVIEGYDGRGEDRVLFYRVLGTHTVSGRD